MMMGSSIKNHDVKDGISVTLTGGRWPCHDTLQVLPFGPPTGPVPQPHLKPRETQTSVIHCELDISVWHLKLGLSQAKPVIIPIPTQKPVSTSDLLTMEGGNSNLPAAQDTTLEVNLEFPSQTHRICQQCLRA